MGIGCDTGTGRYIEQGLITYEKYTVEV
eukprot:SAG31_NODE_28128_length_415_cov_0.689873_2_plen_27_part_01